MIDLNEVRVSAGTGVHFSGQHLQKLIYLYKSMASGVVCNAQGKTIQFGHQIKKIREAHAAEDKLMVSKLKEKLYAFTVSGTFAVGSRKKDGLIVHSGRIQADFDHIGFNTAELLKHQLAKDPHCEFAAISPSGDGLKGSILIPRARPM